MARNLKTGKKPNQPAVLHKKRIFFLFLKKASSLPCSTSDIFSTSSAHRTCAKEIQVSRVIGKIFLYNSVTLGCIYAIHRRNTEQLEIYSVPETLTAWQPQLCPCY